MAWNEASCSSGVLNSANWMALTGLLTLSTGITYIVKISPGITDIAVCKFPSQYSILNSVLLQKHNLSGLELNS